MVFLFHYIANLVLNETVVFRILYTENWLYLFEGKAKKLGLSTNFIY
jgi:hypothetical protein